jgi:hypothetical protein
VKSAVSLAEEIQEDDLPASGWQIVWRILASFIFIRLSLFSCFLRWIGAVSLIAFIKCMSPLFLIPPKLFLEILK